MGKSINDLNPSVEPNVKINTEQNELETSLEQAYSQQGLVESNEQSGIEATNTAGYSRAQSTAYNVLSSASLNDVLTSMEEDEENIEHARFSIYPRNNVPKAIKATPIYKFINRNVNGGYDASALSIQESLDVLGLNKYDAQLDNLLISMASLKLSHEEIIQQVLSHFAKIKREFSVTNLYVGAGFPLGLARESYNLSLCQAEQELVRELLSTRWLHKGLFLLMHGGPGLGKNLLSIHLGKLAISQGYRTLFFNASDFFERLKKHQERYGETIKGELFNCKLLIIDDIGHCLPEDLEISNLFYRLVDHRDSNGLSMIFTSNQEPNEWIKCIKGLVETRKAALDRIMHSAIIVKHAGPASLRVRKFTKLNPGICLK